MSFTDDEIREVALLEAGSPMEGGERYVDLAEPGQGVITTTSVGQRVPEGHVYVRQSGVSSETWYRLAQMGKR
jgi:hypothetical protein